MSSRVGAVSAAVMVVLLSERRGWRCRRRAPRSLSFRLEVRFDEPEPFVDAARDLREEIGGIEVAEIVGLVDRCSGRLAERRQDRRERLDVSAAVDGARWIFAERGSLR